VAVLESAVAPHPHERPGAAELAWALFGSATAVPLHLVEGEDEVSAVTFRLRAAATAPEPDVRRRGRHARTRGRPTGRRSWRVGAVGVAALALVGAGLAAAVASGGPAEPALRMPVAPVTPRAPSPPPAGAGTTSPVTPATPHARAPEAADGAHGVPSVRDAPSRRPLDLIEALAAVRARAWRTCDPGALLDAEVPGSALLAHDTAAVEVLARSGLRYDGLRYPVGDVVVESAGRTTAVLRATLGTSGYDVVGSGRSRRVAPTTGEELLVDLAWTDAGWRLAGLRPAG
jgi:hypothetical protein